MFKENFFNTNCCSKLKNLKNTIWLKGVIDGSLVAGRLELQVVNGKIQVAIMEYGTKGEDGACKLMDKMLKCYLALCK